MPRITTLGGMSSRGLGQFAQSQDKLYIEDVFSTWLYTGNGTSQTISNGIGLFDTAEWSGYKLREGTSTGYGVSTDSSGNVYAVGNANDGTSYIILAKYSPSGSIQWQRKLREGSSIGYGVSVDPSGNICLVGQANDGSQYAIVAKYDPNGAIQWQRKFRQGASFGRGIATDSSGNIYITGNATDGSNYIFIVKYDTNGVIQWQRKLRQNSSGGYAIATDSSNNVYVSGTANDGSDYAILAKYDTNGAIQWQRKIRQSNSYSFGVSTDTSGNVYLSGYGNDGTDYALLAKYNSSGVLQWQRKIKENSSIGYRTATDSSGNVYVTGSANDGVTYILVAKYDTNGNIQWQRELRQNASTGRGIDVDTFGNVYVTGNPNDGSSYNIIVKLKADGTTTSGSAFVEMSPGVATDSAGTATDSAGTATDGAGTGTDSAGTATDSAGTATSSTATQKAVTGADGLVWIKQRTGSVNHAWFDTERGGGVYISSNTTAANTSTTDGVSFRADGFSIGSLGLINGSSDTYASWTFRKAPKFFDVVTFTSDSTKGATFNHSLNSVPGMVIVKSTGTNNTESWWVWHRTLSSTQYLALNSTSAVNSATPTLTATNTSVTLGNNWLAYANAPYVAYLFAHDTTADGVIQCGSFTTDGSGNASVALGYEPQWILFKPSSAAGDWWISDNMRGLGVSSTPILRPNTSGAEQSTNNNTINATGFSASVAANTTYIYMAIRRGPMRTPTDATKVFTPITRNGTSAAATISGFGFPPDTFYSFERTGTYTGNAWWDKLRGVIPVLRTSSTGAEVTTYTNIIKSFDNNGMSLLADTSAAWVNFAGQSYVYYALGRAPNYYDTVCYSGTGSTASFSHNLSSVPELMIIKRRNTTGSWYVYSSATGASLITQLQLTSAATTDATAWNNTPPTSSVFTVGTSVNVNASGSTYAAYLFATCPGVSKVGSYTGTGTTQQINCGFTAGARFVLIKRTDSTGDWYVYDSARGIVAGNDPYFFINSSAAEVTTTDYVDTYAAGFELSSTAPAALNANGGTYIYLAIA